jgi:ATP-dependent DNA helicase, recQ family
VSKTIDHYTPPPGQPDATDQALQDIWGEPISPEGEFLPDTATLPATQLATETPVDRNDPRAVLQAGWGYADFRGIQREIIDSLLAGHDTLGLMPTGGGKSITFQVPALMMEGTCLVITPLIALMKDQVENLRRRKIRATAIHSGLSREEINRELDNVILGEYKFLYLSPERIHTELFRFKLAYMKVSFIAVDEAHCISQWGYDFRPSYLQVREIRHLLPTVPILALTATATATVVDDIQTQLGFRERRVFRMSFERANLTYLVRQSEDKLGDLIALLHQSEGSAIVYTRSRGGTRDTALALQSAGIPALYYHAGLPTEDKNARQEAWQNDRTRVMVATNAFGMGIDKPDVRLVVHLDPPDSLEAYFQEAGRAGRDGAPAEAILLTHPRDVRLLSQRIAQTFPPKEKIREVYDDVAYYLQIPEGEGEEHSFEFDLEEFCRRFRYFPLTVVSAFAILERAGYLLYTDKHERRSRLMMIVKREELYRVHNRVAEGDKVLTALFRTYTGLFADYVFIEEKALAAACGLSEEVLYEKLMALNRARLLHYIPHKSVSTLRYLTRRTLGERLNIGADAYETRLDQYTRRIEGVVRYCTDRDTCRSRMLLEYFDDPAAHDCGRCDVCRPTPETCTPDAQLEANLFQLLADGRPHTVAEWHVAQLDAERAGQLLQQLLDEGRLLFDGAQLTLPTAPTSPEN